MYILVIRYRNGNEPSAFIYPTKEHATDVAMVMLDEHVLEIQLFRNTLDNNEYGSIDYLGVLNARHRMFVK